MDEKEIQTKDVCGEWKTFRLCRMKGKEREKEDWRERERE